MEKLNRKLAEWAGFIRVDAVAPINATEFATWYWNDPTGAAYLPEEVNFTESPDARFEWLVPKLRGLYKDVKVSFWYARIAVDHEICEIEAWTEEGKSYICREGGKSSALAFCLAVEKLIDGEVKDERRECKRAR